MRRIIVAVIALCGAVLAPQPATAGLVLGEGVRYVFGTAVTSGTAGGVTWNGLCRVDVVAERTVTGRPDTYFGVLAGAVVAVDAATGQPASGTLRCRVVLDGVTQTSTLPVTGTGLLTAAATTTYTADETQSVLVCADVTFGATTRSTCAETTASQVPPQEALDLLDVTRVLDPVLCPVLATLAPGVPGVVDVTAQGDVSVLGGKVWDCPPYA